MAKYATEVEIEHAYLEVTTVDPPGGSCSWSIERQLEWYREYLGDLARSIKRHCDGASVITVLTSKKVCSFCKLPWDQALYDDGEPGCCNEQQARWKEQQESPDADMGDRRGTSVYCSVCQRRKKPVGRSAPMEMANGLCDDDCEGYRAPPYPGSLWPGELASEFGFPVSDDGTEAVEE